ncbi:molybdate ABC transporter substrate-binding protein [Microcoleus sp. FACHB-1515]|uniref:molybdate ABC transporter substrate-binding protein n=1 Tax=Cyanophyceae TaxID=3028117 RepID=UPI00168645AF|nr:molybdate ABC transporter substrate-binding protein [Microcoleus sp. FACHB-1515]MBD2089545.1 molybdate ABC transporter substrate-binding protein [Microcoleus sp. FACHB-1515]
MNRRGLLVVLGLLAALLLSAALRFLLPSTQAESTTLLVAAAASLQNVLEELDPSFERGNSGITINYNFAASSPLQQQIEQGAPVDVFISAAAAQMDALQTRNLILPETRRNLLTNELVLIVPSRSTLELSTFQQMTEASIKRIAIGEPRSVPAGRYAQELLENLGILESLRSKFVYGNSVRSVLGTVESGDADAGIVYATDARISDRVRPVATAPRNLHSPIVYPIAVIRSSRHPQAARTYADFLSSPAAQAGFRQAGFGITQ